MKKILCIMLLSMMFILSGCGNTQKEDAVSKVTKYLSNLNSYSLASTMAINRPDKQVSINVGVDYLSPSYYKVTFRSQDDNEQMIIKNDSGVYVLTPSLNKQFKFDSDWPLNSSHAYLLEAINKDIKADETAVGTTEESTIKIECAIKHKTNQNLTKMVFICSSSDLTPKKTAFLNEAGEEIITVDFNSFTPNKNLTKDYFSESKYLQEQEESSTPSDGETASIAVTAGYVLDGNSLKTSSTVDNVTILCYSGEKPYTIIVQKAEAYAEAVVLESYTYVDVLSSGLCFINDNCMRYFMNDYEITIYSTQLTVDDYINIASAITLV